MGKLKEIEDRVERGVHNMEERRDERVTYLKTQGLLCNQYLLILTLFSGAQEGTYQEGVQGR